MSIFLSMSRNQNHPLDFLFKRTTHEIPLNRSMKVLGYAGSTLIQLFFCASPNIKMMGIDVLLHGANRRVKKCKTQLSTATDARRTCSLKKNFGFSGALDLAVCFCDHATCPNHCSLSFLKGHESTQRVSVGFRRALVMRLGRNMF